ncbi:TraC family protein [Ferrimonas kyonanensis]|uniref:TraC family protein n=1 Tax=Ferrimonas kyonanensis TaxID=364763 RepID=UPI0003F92541|nr:TraC family protein [Ferrimonas kyonanensis]
MGLFQSPQPVISRPFEDCFSLLTELDGHPGVFICDGGYLTSLYLCQPLSGSNDALKSTMQTLLQHKYPDDTVISFFNTMLPNYDWLLDGSQVLRGGRMAPGDSQVADEMAMAYDQHFRDNRYSTLSELPKAMRDKGKRTPFVRARDINVLVCIKTPIQKLFPNVAELEGFNEASENVFAGLSNAFMHPRKVNDREVLDRLQSILVRNADAGWRGAGPQLHDGPLNKQILPHGNGFEHVGNGVIKLSNGHEEDSGYATVMTPTRWPDHLAFGGMINFMGDWRQGQDDTMHAVDSMMVTHIHLPNQIKAKASFNSRKKRQGLTAKGKVLEWITSLKYQHQDYAEIHEEIEQEGAALCNVTMQFVVFGDDRAQLRRTTRKLRTAFKTTTGFEFAEETDLCVPMMLSALPTNVEEEVLRSCDRALLMTSTCAAHLTPLYGSWKGNSITGPINMMSRLGQLMNLDLFVTSGGFNGVVCAATGRGKSFLINYLVDTYLGSGVVPHGLDKAVGNGHQGPQDGAQVFIVDAGDSYANMCDQYQDSQYLKFSGNMPFSLDPFATITNWRDEMLNGDDVPGQSPMVVSLFESMLCATGELNNHERSALLNHLTMLWDDKGQDTSIDDVEQSLAKDPDAVIRKLAVQLKPWATGGVYEAYFTKDKPTVNFTSRLVVLELGNLKTNPHMQRVVLMALVNAAQHAMFQQNNRRSLFIADECWEFLKENQNDSGKGLSEFLETAYRRFRKTRASGLICTQSLFDLYNSSVGMALINNSDWRFIMGQKEDAVEALKASGKYPASDQEYELMKSVHTDKGAYSEVMIEYEGSRQICKFVVPRYRQIIYSTDPDDRTAVNDYISQGMSPVEACRAVARDEMAA